LVRSSLRFSHLEFFGKQSLVFGFFLLQEPFDRFFRRFGHRRDGHHRRGSDGGQRLPKQMGFDGSFFDLRRVVRLRGRVESAVDRLRSKRSTILIFLLLSSGPKNNKKNRSSSGLPVFYPNQRGFEIVPF
jgi:hypothetical protein